MRAHERTRQFRAAPFAPPDVDPRRTQQSRCKSCRRPVVWVEMVDTGKMMICDPRMEPGDGRRMLVTREQHGDKVLGRLVRASSEQSGLVSHWATCPTAKQHRRPEPPPQPTLFDEMQGRGPFAQ